MNEDQLTRALIENFLRDRQQPMPSLSPEQQEALAKLVQGSMSHKTRVDPDANNMTTTPSITGRTRFHRQLGLDGPSDRFADGFLEGYVPPGKNEGENSFFSRMNRVADESEQEFMKNNPRYRSVSRNLPFNQR